MFNLVQFCNSLTHRSKEIEKIQVVTAKNMSVDVFSLTRIFPQKSKYQRYLIYVKDILSMLGEMKTIYRNIINNLMI